MDLIGRTNVYFSGSTNYDVGLIECIALWISDMLKMFGLGEGFKSSIGWGKAGQAEAGGADVSVVPLHSTHILVPQMERADNSLKKDYTLTSAPSPLSETRSANLPLLVVHPKTFWHFAIGSVTRIW